MRILLCHNHYQQAGGEDQSFADETGLLESYGHEVVQFTRHNDTIHRMGRWEVARRTLWNRQTYAELRELIRRRRPDLMHCVNIFPLISPAAYYAAQAEGVPVVQSLCNYRLFCCNSLLLRDGRRCEDCAGKRFAWPGVWHACYRQSRAASAVVAAMQTMHRAMKTWSKAVDQYVALTEFARRKIVHSGLAQEKVTVRPRCVYPDPHPGSGAGGYAVFVGRLSPEKGIDTLLEAWRLLNGSTPLKIVGDGPLASRVSAAAARQAGIQWLGRQPLKDLLSIVGEARCLVMPSVCYETFGRTIAEAYAKGTPVVASRLGAMAELVDDGCTGLLFAPGEATDLANKVTRLMADPGALARMRRAAREEYQRKYTAEANYRMTMSIYRRVLNGRLPAVGPAAIGHERAPVTVTQECVTLREEDSR